MNNSPYFLLEYGVEIINLPKTYENRNIEQFQHFIRNKIYWEESMLCRIIPALIFENLQKKGYNNYKIRLRDIEVIRCTFVEQHGIEVIEYGESMISAERMQIFANKYSQMCNCNKFPSYLNV